MLRKGWQPMSDNELTDTIRARPQPLKENE